MDSMWETVKNKCLTQASAALDTKTASTAGTAETVKVLVETAIVIELLNLRRQEQNRFCAAGRLGSVSRPQAKES